MKGNIYMAIRQNIKITVDSVVFGYQDEELKLHVIGMKDQVSKEEEQQGMPEPVYHNGRLLKERTLSEVRNRVAQRLGEQTLMPAMAL